jgi:hypothetical protein
LNTILTPTLTLTLIGLKLDQLLGMFSKIKHANRGKLLGLGLYIRVRVMVRLRVRLEKDLNLISYWACSAKLSTLT